MRDKILEKARELFLSLGFKSVTMDEIANSLGVSKKTVYTHFKNKTTLVEAVTLAIFETVCTGINAIGEEEQNPIEALYQVKIFLVSHYLKGEKASSQYQLQKYYPKIYDNLKAKQFELMQGSVKANLERGIQLCLYRKTIDINFTFRIYFNGIAGIKNKALFPVETFSISSLMDHFLEYHLRGICTEKGIKILENQLKKE